MKIRTKVTLSCTFFLAVAAGVGVWCHGNITKEEEAFARSRRAMRTQQAVTDIEYFLVRQGRAIQNYVLLGDEAEKLQFQQAESQINAKLSQWRESSSRKETNPEEFPAVEAICRALAVPVEKVNQAMDRGRRGEAMALVESELGQAFAKALTAYKEVRVRVTTAAAEVEQHMLLEVRRNHLSLLAGLALTAFFGLVFLVSFYKSVIIPIRQMQDWATRVAGGERNIPWQFSGQNELTELAASLGEMAIALTRPRAMPPPQVEVPEEVFPVHETPKPTVPAVVRPPVPNEFDEAVEGFRDILAQMGGQKSRKIG